MRTVLLSALAVVVSAAMVVPSASAAYYGKYKSGVRADGATVVRQRSGNEYVDCRSRTVLKDGAGKYKLQCK